ncbi:hypothetical protein CEXT_603341 [Caerostris extrusa]|uniref:Uncharacterized protein n=1 Tax=Caerostris extrusa TaxID=172846 RepID=A0AAV4N5A6_CAEEX|nr:hypothetical protein CEXT_603341 [Caerostris extrusa]
MSCSSLPVQCENPRPATFFSGRGWGIHKGLIFGRRRPIFVARAMISSEYAFRLVNHGIASSSPQSTTIRKDKIVFVPLPIRGAAHFISC